MAAKIDNYLEELMQFQRYVRAPRTLKSMFDEAKGKGWDAAFSERGHLIVCDNEEGTRRVYDRDARLMHLTTPKIGLFSSQMQNI